MLSINKTMEGIMAENNIGKITQVIGAVIDIKFRSEERRVGKECRSRWSPYH